MTWSPTLADLGEQPYVSVTTFRKTGAPVATAVWVARDGDALVVTTSVDSGKVKRIRNNPAVELRACDRMGKVKDGTDALAGTATIVDAGAEVERYGELFRAKYRLQYRLLMWMDRPGKSGKSQRVMLRITANLP